VGKYRICPEGYHVSIYRTCTPSYGIVKRKRPEAQPYISCLVCFFVVLLGRETSLLRLLAPLLPTRGKGADLVIHGNVVVNTLSARSTSTLLQNQIYINSPSSRQVSRPSRTVLRDRLRCPLRNGTNSMRWNLLLFTGR
jgi:hypothetical protein